MAKILVVEDDQTYAETVKDVLEADHHLVDIASGGQSALDHIQVYIYDLIILDWNLPQLSGLDICSHLRASGKTVPILFLTCNNTVDYKVTGYDCGADDYITKPVHPRELVARVRASLRRPRELAKDVLAWKDLTLDTRGHCVERNGKTIHLLPREFSLLEFLLKNKGQVFSQNELLDRVWSSDADVTLDTARSTIRRVRSKIDGSEEPSIIRTVYSVGYTIDPD
jgi:two-component system phosphate regulon response regulator PhoB